MATFPSAEWFELYARNINASEDHRRMAAGWEGVLTYVIEAEPSRNVPADVHAWADLWHGECRELRIVSPDEGARARFVIRAPYSVWKEAVRGRLDPVKALTQGRLRLTGDLKTIARYRDAANELVKIAATVPTEFPDEPPA